MNHSSYDPDTVHARLRDSRTRRKNEKREEDLAAVRQAFIQGLDKVDPITGKFDIWRSDTNGVDGPLLHEYVTLIADEFNQDAEKYHYYVSGLYSSNYVEVTLYERRDQSHVGLVLLLLALVAVFVCGFRAIRRKILR
jgi:hypothetical protein